jgi:catalase
MRFRWTNAAGESRYIRYQFIPVGGEPLLRPEEVAGTGRDYLIDEIEARVAKRPFAFEMYAQIAEPGDAIDDPSIPWPSTRRRVRLGKIEITRLAANTSEQDQALAFSPNSLLDGIKTADPMLDFRSKAYPISVAERRTSAASKAAARR